MQCIKYKNEGIKIITINIPYLYHTTPFFTKENIKNLHIEIVDMLNHNGVKVKVNSYIPFHNGVKWFTVSPCASYGGGDDYVYLKYIITGTLKLADFRLSDSKKYDRVKYVIDNNLDGYIDYEDFTEIYLLHNEKHISNMYERFEYSPSPKSNITLNPYCRDPNKLKFNYYEAFEYEKRYINKNKVDYVLILIPNNDNKSSKSIDIENVYGKGLPRDTRLSMEIESWMKYINN